jgi:protein TonB
MFESSLIDLEAKKQPKRRRWLSLPLAIVLHLVGLTAFAFASYWSVGSVQEPPINVAFIDVMLPPPPPPGGGHPQPPPPVPHDRAQTAPQPPTTPVQPEVVRDLTPAPAPPTTEDVTPGPPSEGPVTPSSGSGDGPGLGDGPGPDSGSHGSGKEPGGLDESAPQILTAEMSRPVALRPIQPRYTEMARRAGMQGTVIVEAVIDERGNATNVRVLRGLPMGLDRAAMEAIQQTQFKPAMIGSRPVKVYYTLTVTFTIQR